MATELTSDKATDCFEERAPSCHQMGTRPPRLDLSPRRNICQTIAISSQAIPCQGIYLWVTNRDDPVNIAGRAAR